MEVFLDPARIVVFTPFAGIGSEMYQALLLGRRAYGCELKDEYAAAIPGNMEKASRLRRESQTTLFDALEANHAG